MVTCCHCGVQAERLWKCYDCGCTFCNGCAKEWSYVAGNAQCPKCSNWTSGSAS